MIRLKCVCGYCDDYMEMDEKPVVSFLEFGPIRGIKVVNMEEDREKFTDLVIPESLAQVIQKWVEENNVKE